MGSKADFIDGDGDLAELVEEALQDLIGRKRGEADDEADGWLEVVILKLDAVISVARGPDAKTPGGGVLVGQAAIGDFLKADLVVGAERGRRGERLGEHAGAVDANLDTERGELVDVVGDGGKGDG